MTPSPPSPPSRPAGGTAFFFAVALGRTWGLQLPAVLGKVGVLPGGVEPYFALAALGGFGPLVAAALAAQREAGRAGVRALFASLRPTLRDVPWTLVALLLFPAIYAAGVAGLAVAGGALPWWYPPTAAEHVVAMALVPVVEETGWRGFALPRLTARHGALRASPMEPRMPASKRPAPTPDRSLTYDEAGRDPAAVLRRAERGEVVVIGGRTDEVRLTVSSPLITDDDGAR